MESGTVKAVIDAGTNSVKFLAAAMRDGSLSVLADEMKVTRLGEGQSGGGTFGAEAMERTASVIEGFARRALAYGAEEIAAVGTQAMRTSANTEEFKRMVRKRCGLDIRVISGDEEAELSFRAASRTMPRYAMVFDVGGGSSEAAFGRGGSISWRRSVPIGALVLYERFFASSPGPYGMDALDACRAFAASEIRTYITASLARLPREGCGCAGVGGTFAALASVSAGKPRGHETGGPLSRGEVERQIALYASMDCESRKKIPGLEAGRADIILPGACVVSALMDLFALDRLTVSARGLRHGVMDSMIN